MTPLRRLSSAFAILGLLGACVQPGAERQPRPALAVPANDGSACYAERERYYRAVQDAQATEQIYQFGTELAAGILLSGIAGNLGVGGNVTVSQIASAIVALQDGLRRDRERTASYNAAFDELSDCRFRAARDLRRDVRQGRVNKAEGQNRMQTLKTAQVEDITVARKTNQVIAQRSEKFETEVSTVKQKAAADPSQTDDAKAVERELQTNQKELARSEKSVEVAEAKVTEMEISALEDLRKVRTRHA